MARALDSAETRFRTLVDNSSDVLAVTDADATIRVLAGPAEVIFGVRPESLIGASMFDLVRPSDLDRARTLWSYRTSTLEATQGQDFWIERADGGWVCVNVKTTNHLDDPAIAGVVVTARDVTEHRDSARRLIDAANAALVLAHSEQDLFSEICRIVVAAERSPSHLGRAGGAQGDSAARRTSAASLLKAHRTTSEGRSGRASSVRSVSTAMRAARPAGKP